MNSWTKEIIQKVWNKATEVKDVDGKLWRKDIAGAWISRKHYGNKFSEYAWEINMIKPESNTIGIMNLQPLQWENNITKGNNYPFFNTSKSADINSNKDVLLHWEYRMYSSRLSNKRHIQTTKMEKTA